MTHPAIGKLLSYYERLAALEEYSWVCWSENRVPFSITKANEFFIGILLDQGQKAERAWDGGRHLVKNHFSASQEWFWYCIYHSSFRQVEETCKQGYDGTSYAVNYTFNKFPIWLKSAADKMLTEYDGDPRKIWAVSPSEVSLIYDRLKEFDGIGDALAKMGQFILVRKYAVAGGSANQHLMAIKPDELVRRVMYRTGVSTSSKVKDVIASTKHLCLRSPADFDAASWTIGRKFCRKTCPNCKECPIYEGCERVGLS